jgi:hypothetical protein
LSKDELNDFCERPASAEEKRNEKQKCWFLVIFDIEEFEINEAFLER